jgi:SAM-dependent methyltransferase
MWHAGGMLKAATSRNDVSVPIREVERPVELEKRNFIPRHVRIERASSVLELGCGKGFGTQTIKTPSVVGIEISTKETFVAKAKAQLSRWPHQQVDRRAGIGRSDRFRGDRAAQRLSINRLGYYEMSHRHSNLRHT